MGQSPVTEGTYTLGVSSQNVPDHEPPRTAQTGR